MTAAQNRIMTTKLNLLPLLKVNHFSGRSLDFFSLVIGPIRLDYQSAKVAAKVAAKPYQRKKNVSRN